MVLYHYIKCIKHIHIHTTCTYHTHTILLIRGITEEIILKVREELNLLLDRPYHIPGKF